MAREIPEGSIEIQTGLYVYDFESVIGGTTYVFRRLYSAEGYCYYDLNQPENYDEEGNLKPPAERVYKQYSALAVSQSSWTYEQLNARYISVPIEDGFEIVSVPNNTETA